MMSKINRNKTESDQRCVRFNRQLHPQEKTQAEKITANAKAQGITNPNGSLITVTQVENAMRSANNSQYGETIATGMVVPLDASTPASAVYDPTGMKLTNDGVGNNYLVQDPSMLASPSQAVMNLIQQNTGGTNSPYSWNVQSPEAAQANSTPALPANPFAPGWNTGDYAAGFGMVGRGVAGDYATVNIGSLSENVTGAINLHDSSAYVGGGVVMANSSSVTFRPGVSGTVGYIIGSNSTQATSDFLAGDGMQGFVSIPAPLLSYNGSSFSAATYGGMVQQTPASSLFHYSANDANADQKAAQAVMAAHRPGSIDYVTFQGGAGFGGSITINMHDGNVYVGGSVSASREKGAGVVVGMIPDNVGKTSDQKAEAINILIKGQSVGGNTCIFGVCGGLNH